MIANARPNVAVVLVVVGQLDRGGTEQHLVRVLPRACSDEINVKVCALRAGGALAGSLRSAGIDVFEPRSQLNSAFGALRFLAHTARSLKPSVVHFFLPKAYLLGSVATLGLPVKRVMSRRSLAHYQKKYPGLPWIERLLHARMDVVLANSRAVAEELRAEGVTPSRLGLIYNGVAKASCEVDRLSARARIGLPANELVFVCVANLVAYKGHRDLLVALAGACPELPARWTLALVGRDDGIGSELRELAIRSNLASHLRWVGAVDDVTDWWAAADIGVLASHEEGFSNAVLEGMAAGLPMVVTDVGGNAEAVTDRECGRVVPVSDPAALSSALVSLARDPAARARLGANARRRVTTSFDESRCAGLYRELWKNLANDTWPPIPAGARISM